MARKLKSLDPLQELEQELAKDDPGFKERVAAQVSRRQIARRLLGPLVEVRNKRGLSQAKIAKRMGTSQPAVARMESGASDPLFSTVHRYAHALGTDVDLRVRDEKGFHYQDSDAVMNLGPFELELDGEPVLVREKLEIEFPAMVRNLSKTMEKLKEAMTHSYGEYLINKAGSLSVEVREKTSS